MLRHPYILGDPQRQMRGAKSEVAPKVGEQYQKWLPHPCLLGGPNDGRNAVSPLHSPGSPTPSTGSQARGAKSEVVPNKGEQNLKWLPHPCLLGGPKEEFLGMATAKRGEQNQRWVPHPCLLGGPKEGANATSPLHSWGSPTPSAVSKIKSGPLQRGTKSKVAASPLPSRGPKGGRKCYVTRAFFGVPEPGVQKGPSPGQWKKAPQSGGQDEKWPTSGPKVLKPSFFFLEVLKPIKESFCLLGSEPLQKNFLLASRYVVKTIEPSKVLPSKFFLKSFFD